MSDFLSRTISLILIFFMLVIAPLVHSYGVTEMENRRLLLNEVTLFLDKVTDKGNITEDDLNEFYMKTASYGMVLDVTVRRLIKVSTSLPTGGVNTTYVAADDMENLNQRDIVQVELKEISTSPYRKIMSIFLKLDEGNYQLIMAEMVK